MAFSGTNGGETISVQIQKENFVLTPYVIKDQNTNQGVL